MKKIVVVDDQPVLTSIYRAKFSAQGFQVGIAADGEQALEVIKRTRPDLVLLDLMLPKISGLDVLKHLRALPDFKTLPIVVFSNAAKPETVEEAWTAGATLVLLKSSTSPTKLVEAVQTLLANSTEVVRAASLAPRDEDPIPFPDLSETRNAAGAGEILLIENNPDCRAIAMQLLVAGGQRVIHAEGLNHGLLLAATTRFDLVITNRGVAPGSFRTFSVQLKRSSPGLPWVMYSLDGLERQADEALRDGAAKFLGTVPEFLNLAAISASLIAGSRNQELIKLGISHTPSALAA
ncbi:MAG: two-component system, OmpR family, alkaline phosphatase synthesis response regulator PhoP [Blastocatellia bacterium]|nr:two-component system, OmpR family, alkaline phosphatase synthesis response regulator PhoP [Blastocatellia bacterium]